MMTISLLSCRLSKMATLNLKPEEVILVEDQDLKIGQTFLPEELLQNLVTIMSKHLISPSMSH